MDPRQEHIHRLYAAELQFRLASAVRLAVSMGKQPLDLPVQWSHGSHVVEYKEIALRPDQADFAAHGLQLSATLLMAVAIRDGITAVIRDPKSDASPDVRATYQISRMIRNAFAHGPTSPKWSIDDDCRDQTFAVRDIITLDTRGLQGQPFDWRQYGGPLALFRLCHFVRFEVLRDTSTKPTERSVDDPKIAYYQQGDLILRKLDD